MKECQNRKNILLNNGLTSVDVDNNGDITSINTRDLKTVDANDVSVGKLESSINSLPDLDNRQKVFTGDDSIEFHTYKIPMTVKKGYFLYSIDNNSKIDSITIANIKHISCSGE